MELVLGRNQSTKPCVCPCKVAAGSDERYLLCAAGAAVVSASNRIVMAAWMCRCCCNTHCNGCMNVAPGLCWGGSRSTKPGVFPCKVAAGGDERYFLCAAGAAAVVSGSNRFLLCAATSITSGCKS